MIVSAAAVPEVAVPAPAETIAPAPVITISRTSDLVGLPVAPILAGGAEGSKPSRLPFSARSISSRFGQRRHPVAGNWHRHSGVDFAAGTGTPVSATGSGTVTRSGWAGNYGYMVVIDHGDGVETRYAHLSRLDVAKGSKVDEGHQIGLVGSTGRSTGPHLHYEIRVNGAAVDPLRQ